MTPTPRTLVLTLDGATVAARLADARVVHTLPTHSTDLPAFTPHPEADTLAFDPRLFMAAVEGSLLALCGEGAGQGVDAILIETTARSLVGIGRENVLATEALVHRAGPLDPPTRMIAPATAREVRRWVGLGALVVRFLSREWIDLLGRAPAGIPVLSDTLDYPRDRALFADLGVRLAACPILVPATGVLAQVKPEQARRLGLPDFTPIFAAAIAPPA